MSCIELCLRCRGLFLYERNERYDKYNDIGNQALGFTRSKNASGFTSWFFREFENYVVVSNQLKGHFNYLVTKLCN